MAIKTTKKAIVNGCSNIKKCGYCDLSALLRNHEPIAYTCGIYGWNFDVYRVYGLTICTGYRNMPGKQLDKINDFELAAEKIWKDYENYKGVDGYERQKSEVEKLLKEFCKLNGGNDSE